MAHVHTPITAPITSQPIHSMLAQFPVVCFPLTLLTDIAYWRTSHLMWLEFSCWLLLAGLVFGALALVAGLIELVVRPAIPALAPAWPHPIGGVVVLALAFLNSLVHARDGWTAVVPWGLTLSALTVLVIIVTEWSARALASRHTVRVNRDIVRVNRAAGVSRHD